MRSTPRWTHRSDQASTHVLEAVVIVSIMVSAVAFVATVETPTPPTHNAREQLEVKARDALDILYDTPVTTDNFGSNELSAFIAKCLNKKCTDLERKLEKLLPAGASYALYVSNGHETYPVLINGTPRGEAVTASRTFQPEWSSTFLATATESIGTTDALLTYALPIYHSTTVSPGGSQIFVKVSGTRVSDGSDYVLIASASTTAQATGDPTAMAVSLAFVDADGDPLPVHVLDPVELLPYRMTLRLSESQGADIPAGAEVTIHTPRGWTAVAPPAENPDWTILADATDKNGAYAGSAIRAALVDTLREDHRDLVFDVTYHGDVLDYYPFTATLTKGANAMASTIVRGEVHSSVPPLATPLLHLSVPGPMGRGAETSWTLSAYVPVNEDSELPNELRSAVRVHTVELIEQEGNPIFGEDVDATPAEAMDGTWASTGSSLVWKGDVLLDSQNLLNLTFRLGASGTAGPPDIRSHFVPPVRFDDWTGRLVGRTGWGFYRQAILPENEDYAGYDSESGVLTRMHPLNSSGVYRQAVLPGEIPYNVSLAGAVQDSLYGSYVIAEDRSVPIGGEIVINANVQSVLFALAEAGQRAGVTLRFYPPWSGDDRIPELETPMLDQNLLAGEVSQLVALDVNGDGFADPIVGTTNGRVIAYDGRTGQRLQGNVWTVPLNELAETQQAVPRVTVLERIRLYDEEFLVVGTDKYSDGLFVLDLDFNIRWSYLVTNADALVVDVSTDFDGDGEPEIVLVRSHEFGASKYGIVYVLRAPENGATLVALPMDDAPLEDQDRLAMVLGTPTDVLASPRVGPRGEDPGVIVPVQTMFDPGIQVEWTPGGTPNPTTGPSSTPRAGALGIDEHGVTTGTLFGAPASVLKAYDYVDNGQADAVQDVVLGGASGYVVMANGSVLTQPLYSYIMSGWTEIVSADTRSASESYILTGDGQVIMTDDAWVSMYGPIVSAVGAKAISSNAFNSYWVVGSANKVWRSIDVSDDLPDDPAAKRHPAARELEPVVLTATRANAEYPFATNVHELRDVHFRGATGYIVGAACPLPLLCGEPIMLKTTNTGATWTVLSDADGTLENRHGGPLDKNMTRVKVVTYGDSWTGWVVGDGGLIAKNLSDGDRWKELPTDFTYDLLDIACLPHTPDTCWVVGEAGAAFVTYNARDATPTWHNRTGQMGLPADRDLYSVGFPEDTRGYIGSHNMVLATFSGSTWTALPLNYVEADGRVVSTAGDGAGYVYGGTDAIARIWFLHDYHTQSMATTKSFGTRFPPNSHILAASLVDGNVSVAQQTIELEVTDGTEWKSMGALVGDSANDERKPLALAVSWLDDIENAGHDFQARLRFNTSTEKTILTPSVRSLTLRVDWVVLGETPSAGYETITLDLSDLDDVDLTQTSADWNTTTLELRQPIVREYWTRNVSGEVHDIQTGYDADGDAYDDVWVATGDVLSENSPDYVIYAGTDLGELMEKHNRVYRLDGRNGNPDAVSDWLEGEVRHIRLVDDEDPDDEPDILFAATSNTTPGPLSYGKLYALDPVTLDELWSHSLQREVPADIEVGTLPGDNPTAIVGGARPADETARTPHLWSIPDDPPREAWSVIPDDLGKYIIRTPIDPKWFYGPHVVEVAVEWEETVTETSVNANLAGIDELGQDPPDPDAPGGPTTPEGSKVLRAARFYDHFMVQPPDAVTAPNPIYTARLLTWMRDWG